jgi:hypothetical protein
MNKMLLIFLVLSTLVGGVLLAWHFNTRATLVLIDAQPPAGFPEHGFSHASFEQALVRFVDEAGQVDYPAWKSDPDAVNNLDQYLAAVAAFSPENSPERFKRVQDRKAYWLYAYNALVVKSILDHWPLESVTDVRAPLEVVKGLGFFYNQEFILGGERLNLYRLEKEKVLKNWRDPRAHFVLNCGSKGCPIMRPELPTGDELEPFLANAAAEFVADPRQVLVDHENRQITLSTIFKWYEKDFTAELLRRGHPRQPAIIDYLLMVAAQDQRADLEAAREYQIHYRDYDWALNLTEEPTAPN